MPGDLEFQWELYKNYQKSHLYCKSEISIKWSDIEWVILPDMALNSKLLKTILSINVFDFSVTLVGWRINGEKKYEHIIL